MNELRFEISSPEIKLDKYGNWESLTFKDDYGKNEITFEMRKGMMVDIASSILSVLTAEQMEQLAGKMVFEVFDAERVEAFMAAIKAERAEYEQDNRKYGLIYPVSTAVGI